MSSIYNSIYLSIYIKLNILYRKRHMSCLVVSWRFSVEFEKDIEKYLKQRVERDHGGLCLKVSPENVKGIPDRLVVLPPEGRCIWVELKREQDGKLSALQKYQHHKLRKLGAEVVVAWSREDVDKIIEAAES